MELYRCFECNMQFRSIEQLPGRWRLRHHERINHLAKCIKCEKTFASYTHATVHLYQTHDVRCVQCGEECNGLCLMDTVENLENAHNDEKEKMLNKIEKRIEEEENNYLNSFRGVSGRHMMQLQDIARALDEGYTGCMANSWGMLSYLPFMELNPKLGVLSRFGKKLVMRHQYLSALVKMNEYLADRGNLSKVMTNYVNDCMQLNNENETFELMPEMLANTNYCFPEREIGGPEPDQWTNSMYVERYGVIDRPPTKEEPLPIHSKISNQWEAPTPDAITESNIEINIPEEAGKVKEILTVNRANSISLSDVNIYEGNSRETEMKVVEGRSGIQPDETSYETPKRLDYDNIDADIIAEDEGTDKPAGNIYEDYLKKKEIRVPEGRSDVQQEETSYETSKRMDDDNIDADILAENEGTDEPVGNTYEEYLKKK